MTNDKRAMTTNFIVQPKCISAITTQMMYQYSQTMISTSVGMFSGAESYVGPWLQLCYWSSNIWWNWQCIMNMHLIFCRDLLLTQDPRSATPDSFPHSPSPETWTYFFYFFFQDSENLERYLRWSDAVVVVYSITSKQSYQHAKGLFQEIAELQKTKEIHEFPVVVLGNKNEMERYRWVRIHEMQFVCAILPPT